MDSCLDPQSHEPRVISRSDIRPTEVVLSLRPKSIMEPSLTAQPVEPAHPFRFVNLPGEIRNEIYRYFLIWHPQPVRLRTGGLTDLAIIFTNRLTYSEAMLIFLSENSFFITGTSTEHEWLTRLQPEALSELRNVTLYISDSSLRLDYRFFNALSLCTNVHLTLVATLRRLYWALTQHNDFSRNMHGFAAMTAALPEETDVCPLHELYPPDRLENDSRKDYLENIQSLLPQLQAPCDSSCRAHRGREGTHTQATIHVAAFSMCFWCV